VRQQFPQVTVIENGRNLGVPAGYNVGFAHALAAGADYVLMLNNDTVVAPDMLGQLVAEAQSDPRCGIVMPRILYYGTQEQIWSAGWRYRAFPPAIVMDGGERAERAQSDTMRLIEYAPGCGLLIHRRAFEQAGLFDPGYLFLYDDWDFSERVRAQGLHIRYLPQARMWHKVSRTTKGTKSKLFWRIYGASSARYYRRHGRPAWLSLPLHVGYIALREFALKGQWGFLGDFWQGLREGLRQSLGAVPVVEGGPAPNGHGA
jgi:GT2 family glycosyltransferase